MSSVLIADIGGTTSRFALVGADGRPDRVLAMADDEVQSLEAAIARYLERMEATPCAAVLGVAGPVEGDAITLTNRNWCFRLTDIARRFGFASVRALNDFEAVAWSLSCIGADDLRPLGTERGGLPGAKVVFGPGTGLGVAALIPSGAGWAVAASEGGHASFGPGSDEEEPVFARLRAAHGFVSAETVISGPGLERLHRAVHPGAGPTSARAILAGAARRDPDAAATLALFVRLMGRYAGDVALTFKALGGVYLAGGVAQRIGPLIDPKIFRAAFENHPPYDHLLRATPTALITAPEPGLRGCAAFAQAVGAGKT